LDMSSDIVWTDREAVMRSKLADKPLFIATPDTGLISLIAAAHLIQKLNAKLIGYVDAPWVPPVSVVSEGDPYMPIRIYSADKLDILISEVPILPSAWRQFAITGYHVATQLSSIMIVGATGIPNPKRIEIQSMDDLRVFYIGKFLETEGISEEVKKAFTEAKKFTGTLAGPYSSIISVLIKQSIPFVIILVDSYPEYPDPESAARLITELNALLGLNVDISSLIERGAEIRLMARQLALQTRRQQALAGQKTGNPPLHMYV